MGLAFYDIIKKSNLISENHDLQKGEYKYLQDMVEFEMTINIHKCNYKSNTKFGWDKYTEYYLYSSTSRNLLRMLWFYDFCVNLFTNMRDQSQTFNALIKKAYDEELGIHHNWFIRQGAKACMYMVADDKIPFMAQLVGSDPDEEVM